MLLKTKSGRVVELPGEEKGWAVLFAPDSSFRQGGWNPVTKDVKPDVTGRLARNHTSSVVNGRAALPGSGFRPSLAERRVCAYKKLIPNSR
jgi:hypothetical protein